MPPPQESADISYDLLYPSTFHKPATFIRFSQTVEECISCQYDMTKEDDDFLKDYNGKLPPARALSEDDFERTMEVFEDTAAEQTPFAAIDNTVVSYEVMVPALKQLGEVVLEHAKSIYDYWRLSRQEKGNKPLHASLKFETQQERDDTDPYVCFRRREARQTRKTRARDQKVADTLKKLRKELEDGRQLVILSYEREMVKRELLHMDRAVFEERARLKHIKIKVGIKGEDEDLVNQKVRDPESSSLTVPLGIDQSTQPQKRRNTETIAAQRNQTVQARHPGRPDGRSLEVDLVLLADKLAENENMLRSDIENKVQNHRRWNQNHIDLTKDPLSPVREQGTELKFRHAKTQYLMTPPASSCSESMDIDEYGGGEAMQLDKPRHPVFQFKAGGMTNDFSTAKTPAFRRRIGRLNRLWIDRRGLATPPKIETLSRSDRWKYDSDSDDDEAPVWEVDPFDTRALKFRTTIPMNPYMFRPRPHPPPPEPGNAASQLTNNKSLTAAVAAAATAAPVPTQVPQAQTVS